VINDDDAVGLLPRRADGTDARALRIAALLAGDGQIEVIGIGNFVGVVVGIRALEIDALLLFHFQDADPLDLWIARLVVLFHTRVDAAPATDAARKVERVPERDTRLRRQGRHVDLAPEAPLGVVADARDAALELVGRELEEVLLEELFARDRRATG